jgi:hypothetical protein
MRLYLITHVKRCQDKNMTCHRNPSLIHNNERQGYDVKIPHYTLLSTFDEL